MNEGWKPPRKWSVPEFYDLPRPEDMDDGRKLQKATSISDEIILAVPLPEGAPPLMGVRPVKPQPLLVDPTLPCPECGDTGRTVNGNDQPAWCDCPMGHIAARRPENHTT